MWLSCVLRVFSAFLSLEWRPNLLPHAGQEPGLSVCLSFRGDPRQFLILRILSPVSAGTWTRLREHPAGQPPQPSQASPSAGTWRLWGPSWRLQYRDSTPQDPRIPRVPLAGPRQVSDLWDGLPRAARADRILSEFGFSAYTLNSAGCSCV